MVALVEVVAHVIEPERVGVANHEAVEIVHGVHAEVHPVVDVVSYRLSEATLPPLDFSCGSDLSDHEDDSYQKANVLVHLYELL